MSGASRGRPLASIDRPKFEVGDSSGQGFGALAHQVERGGPQQQEVTGLAAGATPVVDDAAEDLEERRCPVDLVDHDELAGLSSQEGIGIVQPAPIGGSLEVEVERLGSPLRGDLARQRRFPDLTRAEEDEAGGGSKAIRCQGLESTTNQDARVLNVTRSISGIRD